MTLPEFIKKTGTRKIREELGITKQSVHSWVIFRNCPRPAQMAKLVKMSRGQLTFEKIIYPYLKNHKN